ncbi:MAG: hypothetical protein QXY52_03120 [Conexivisphaerales archaeon]
MSKGKLNGKAISETKGISSKLFNDRNMNYTKHWPEIIYPKG